MFNPSPRLAVYRFHSPYYALVLLACLRYGLAAGCWETIQEN